MQLRKLQEKDAPYMLEWMHDDEVVHFLNTNFGAKQIEDCIQFIQKNQEFDTDVNLAIVDENDEYMGTVSLKHINYMEGIAEFAITIRKCAMGKGYSIYGMQEILRMALEDIGLKKIYWCVSKENSRAVRFYDKNRFMRTDSIPKVISRFYSNEEDELLLWYVYEK